MPLPPVTEEEWSAWQESRRPQGRAMGALRLSLLDNPPPPVPPPAMLAPEPPTPRPPLEATPSGAPAPASTATMAPAPGAPPATASRTWTFPVQGYDGKVDLHWGSHAGAADLFATPGTPVVAAVGGTVLDAGYSSVGGNNVLIQGADGNQYYYAHLKDAPLVKAGQQVGAGAQLGGVGDTGNAQGTGAHLHFGAGPSILNGTGPAGGAGGGNFDAVGELRRALAGPVPPSATQAVDLHAYARGAAARAGIDPATFERQIQQESGFNPNAKSPAGATGIAQIVPQYHPGVNPTDPIASLDYAANLMAANVAKYGSYATALAAYNAGPGAVAQYGGPPPFEETQRYIRAILPGGKEPPVSAPVHPSSPDLLALTQAAAANTAAVPPYQPPPSPYPRYQPPAPKPLPPPPAPAPALGATAYGLENEPVLGQSSYDAPLSLGQEAAMQPPAPLPSLPVGALSQRPLAGGVVETTFPNMVSVVPAAPTPPQTFPSGASPFGTYSDQIPPPVPTVAPAPSPVPLNGLDLSGITPTPPTPSTLPPPQATQIINPQQNDVSMIGAALRGVPVVANQIAQDVIPGFRALDQNARFYPPPVQLANVVPPQIGPFVAMAGAANAALNPTVQLAPEGIGPGAAIEAVADPLNLIGGPELRAAGKGIEGVAGRAAQGIGQDLARAGEERAIGSIARDLRPPEGFRSAPLGGLGDPNLPHGAPEPLRATETGALPPLDPMAEIERLRAENAALRGETGNPAALPVPPPPDIRIPPPSRGELLQGIGRMDLPTDMQNSLREVWQQYGQKPETISWDETLNDLARKVQVDPMELARRWQDAPRGQISTELASAKAYFAKIEQEKAVLNSRMENGFATSTDIARRDDLNAQEAILMLGVRRQSGELGRALNFLRLGTQVEQAKLSEFQYQQLARVSKEAQQGLQRTAKNGKLDPKTIEKLQALQGALEREASGTGAASDVGALDDLLANPSAPAATRRPRAPRPMSPGLEKAVVEREPSLGEQLVRLNREQNAARDAGSFDRVGEIEPQRQDLLTQITDKIRQQEEAKLKAEKPQLTPEALQREADKVMARGITARLRASVQEELRGPEAAGAKLAQPLARKIDVAIAKDTVDQIDQLLKAAPDSVRVRQLADTMLRQLSTVNGYADQVANAYRERVAKANIRRVLPGNPDAMTPEMIEEFKRLDFTDPRAVQKAAEIFAKDPSLLQQLGAVRVASLLSGTSTQLVNTLGNALMTAYAPVSRAAAATGEQLVTAGGRRRPVAAHYSNVAAELAGMVGSFRAAIDDGARTFQTGMSSSSLRDLSTQRANPIRIPGLTPLNYVFRVMGATDDFARTLNRGGAIMAEADRVAKSKGIPLDQVLLNIADHPEVIKRGAQEAQRRTLQAELPSVGRAINMARSDPALHFLIPFFNTNANALRVGADVSPIGFNRARRAATNPDLIKAGTNLSAAADARGDALIGSGLLTTAAILSAAGLVTGYGPTDERTRNALMDTGWRPFSAKIGGTFVPYQNLLGPFSLPMAMGATVTEAVQNGMSQQKAESALATFVRNSGQYFLNQSGLKGLSDFLKAIGSAREGDMASTGEQMIEGTATSVVPFGGALGTLARATDPTIRNPDNAVEAILSRLPVLSRTVPESLDRWGQTKERLVQGAAAGLPLSGAVAETSDPVRQEVLRLQRAGFPVTPELFPKNVSLLGEAVPLTRDERQGAQREAGTMAHDQLAALMSGPEWRTLPDGVKADLIDQTVQTSRRYVRVLNDRGLLERAVAQSQESLRRQTAPAGGGER